MSFDTNTDTVLFSVEGHVALITLNRPQKRNALDPEAAMAVAAAVDHIEANDDIWVGILAANGPAFCAGADLATIAAEGPDRLLTEEGGFAGLVKRPRAKMLIAAVDGLAHAGGCEIAIACDLVVASTTAEFAVPEARRGFIAGSGGIVMLPRLLPRNVAMWMVTTGLPLSAADAHRYGMVTTLTQPGQALTAAREVADLLVANAPLAVRASREAVVAVDALDVGAHWKLMEELSVRISTSEDMVEGVRAFVEKRTPHWTAR